MFPIVSSLKERTIDIHRWATLFKGRNRNTIKPIEIRKHLSAWASIGQTGRLNKHGHALRPRPLSESSLNHRLSALSNFYVLLKGASTREVQHQLTHSSLELIERFAKVTRAGLSRVMSRIA